MFEQLSLLVPPTFQAKGMRPIFVQAFLIRLLQVFEYRYPDKMWAEPGDFSSLLSNGHDAIFILLPRSTENGNSYQHISKLLVQVKKEFHLHCFSRLTNIQHNSENNLKVAKPSFLSIGNYDVVALESYDAATDTM
ncbi:unnamed protein product [Haemonchus placei]|uniref:Uncharacterized protein n=1 Tax=Haemonchus placei TaxID=6290 RepID=A0A0N4X8J7_HAEPC|nr:unnamed protein product [Haemonchus placei]